MHRPTSALCGTQGTKRQCLKLDCLNVGDRTKEYSIFCSPYLGFTLLSDGYTAIIPEGRKCICVLKYTQNRRQKQCELGWRSASPSLTGSTFQGHFSVLCFLVGLRRYLSLEVDVAQNDVMTVEGSSRGLLQVACEGQRWSWEVSSYNCQSWECHLKAGSSRYEWQHDIRFYFTIFTGMAIRAGVESLWPQLEYCLHLHCPVNTSQTKICPFFEVILYNRSS
jgi:hypothetical protein